MNGYGGGYDDGYGNQYGYGNNGGAYAADYGYYGNTMSYVQPDYRAARNAPGRRAAPEPLHLESSQRPRRTGRAATTQKRGARAVARPAAADGGERFRCRRRPGLDRGHKRRPWQREQRAPEEAEERRPS